MMWWNNGGWGGGEWLMMSVMMLVFWAAVISLVVWLIRRAKPTLYAGGDRQTARADELLAERFARGELDADQFQRSRKLLHDRSSL